MSQQWKAFERDVAAMLRGERVIRGDYGLSDFDVRIPDFPSFRTDAKRYKRHAHHTLLKKVKEKYCKVDPMSVPLLCTRENGSPFTVASMPLSALANLLDTIRECRTTIEVLQGQVDDYRRQLEIRSTAEAL